MIEGRNPAEKDLLEKEIAELEAQLADLKARLPGHSLPPGLMAEWDELDERLEAARDRFAELADTDRD